MKDKNKRAAQPAIMTNKSELTKEALTSLRLFIQRFIGDNVLSTDAYESAVGLGVRFMY